VTPTSKTVGDMAILMVTSGLAPADVLDPEREIAFPESVISFFRGELGQPPGGFPKALQNKILKDEKPITVRPGSLMEDVDLDATRKEVEQKIGRHISDFELGSHLMYPQVFADYADHLRQFGDVSKIPTQDFFYGMEPGGEIAVEMERGKALVIRFLALGDANEDGVRNVFFELNGQPRSVRIRDHSQESSRSVNRVADDQDPNQLGAPMPGVIVAIVVEPGQKVLRGDTLLSIEAMKMETAVTAEFDGTVAEVAISIGDQVNAEDLLVVFEG
jgi:pyruvate carboxylase